MAEYRPKITAIIPLYNGARFIEESLGSVFAQTLPPDEIIVVDDGSTDDGAAIVERIAATRKVTLIRKQNGGQSSARNLGVEHASGDLIALLDQDDIWYPHHLEVLVEPFLEPCCPPLGWVYSNLDEVDLQGRMVVRDTLRLLPHVQHPKRDLFGCLRTDMFILPSASLISKEAFVAVGGFDERLSGFEDDDLFLRMFRAGYENVYIDRALSKWRIFGGSASFTARMARSRMIYLRKLLADYPNDTTQERYFARDFLAPRFFPWLVHEYTTALAKGNKETIRQSLADMQLLLRVHRTRVKVLMAALLPVLRVPFAARLLMPAAIAMRPMLRRMLR